MNITLLALAITGLSAATTMLTVVDMRARPAWLRQLLARDPE